MLRADLIVELYHPENMVGMLKAVPQWDRVLTNAIRQQRSDGVTPTGTESSPGAGGQFDRV